MVNLSMAMGPRHCLRLLVLGEKQIIMVPNYLLWISMALVNSRPLTKGAVS